MSADKQARDALVKKWLTRYQANPAHVLGLGEAVGESGREFSIEDLFPEDFYLERVEQAYDRELRAAGVSKLKLVGKDQLCRRGILR